MPDDRLLLKFGIDLSPVQEAVNSVKNLLGELNSISDNLTSKADATASSLSSHMQDLAAHTDAVTQAAMEGATQDQKKLELTSAIVAPLKEALGIHESSVDALKDQVEQHAKITEQMKEQVKLSDVLKGVGGVGGGFLKGLVGGGLGGQVAGGVLAGGGILEILNGLAEGAEKAAEDFKKLVEESGRLVGLEDVFKRLAQGAGIDADQAFKKLQEETEGLVDKMTLLRVVNAGLKKDIPVERVTELSHAVVTLSESGTTRLRSTAEGMELLARALETGRGRALGAALGMDQFLSRLHDLPAALSPLEKEQLLLKNLEDEIIRRANQIGETPKTISSALEQIKISREDLQKSFAVGFQTAPGFQRILEWLGRLAKGFTEAQGSAEEFGRRLGDAVGPLLESFTRMIAPLGNAISALARGLGTIVGQFSEVAISAASLDTKADPFKNFIAAVIILNGELTKVTLTIENIAHKIEDLASDGLLQALLGAAAGGRVGGLPGAAVGFVAGSATTRKGRNFLGAAGGSPGSQADFLIDQMNLPKKAPAAWSPNFVGPIQPRQTPTPAEIDAETQRQLTELFQNSAGKPRPDMHGEPPPNIPDKNQLQRAAQDQMQAAQAAAKERLAEKQKEIDEEKKLDDLAYKYQKEDADTHYATQLQLIKESGQAQLETLSNTSNAELQLAETRHQLGMTTEKEYTDTVHKIYSDFQKNFVSDQKTTNLQIIALYDQQAKDIEGAIRKGIDSSLALYEKQSQARIQAAQKDLQVQEQSVKAEQALNEKQFGRGEVSPDAYFDKQIASINRLAQAQIDTAQRVAAEKTLQAQAEIAAAKAIADNESMSETDREAARAKEEAGQQKIADAREGLEEQIVAKSSVAEEQLTALIEDQAAKRMNAIQKAYQPQQQALETQLELETQLQAIGKFQPGLSEDVSKQILANLQSQMAELGALSQHVQPYSDEWFTVLDRMEKVYQTQIKYNSELQAMQAMMPNIANFFDGLAKSLSEVLPSKWAQNFLGTVQKGAAAMLQSFQLFGQKAPTKDPALAKLEDEARTMFQSMDASGKNFGAGMDQVTATATKDSTAWSQVSQAAQKSLTDVNTATANAVAPFVAISPVVDQLQQKLIALMGAVDRLIQTMQSGSRSPASGVFVGPTQSQAGLPSETSGGNDPTSQTFKQILTNLYAVTSGQSAGQVAGLLGIFGAIGGTPSLGTAVNDILTNLGNPQIAAPSTSLAQSPYAISQQTPPVPNSQMQSNQGGILAPWKALFGFGGRSGGNGVITDNWGQGGGQYNYGQPVGPDESQGSDQGEVTGMDPGAGASGGGGSFGTALQQVGNQLKVVVSDISAIVSGKSAAAGAVGGAGGGSSLGGMIGSAFGPLGGIIGSGIGAVGGAITGALLGNKQAQITDELNNFTSNFKEIMNEFALNTNNMNQTIVQLQVLQQALTASMNAQKKGKDKSGFEQQIQQVDQQLAQLQQQQNQVLVNMNEQLAILSAPTGMQQYLQSLQQILQQYDQFAGAAQNAQQLTQANQYLVESLQQYSITVSEQYNQANQSAINDAINLNQLYQQRIDLVNQVNTQIESVLSAGVLTRTPTRAQTAGQQIEQIQYEANIQLQTLNEQIQAEQYRVNAETQIFNMSTTTIGLEAQLLVLQNAQTNLDMQRITSLQQVVQMLQSGNFSLIGPLLAAMPGYLNATATGVGTTPTPGGSLPFNGPLTPQQLGAMFAQLAMMPGFSAILAAPNVSPTSGTDAITQQFTAAYNSRAAAGMGAYRGQNLY